MRECPRCGSGRTKALYGGERGEAGPFLYCDECDYSEEEKEKKKVRIDSLLARLEATPKGSNELDEAICELLGLSTDYEAEGNYGPRRILPSYRRFTRSVDAAVTLVPDGWDWSTYVRRTGHPIRVELQRWNDIAPFRHACASSFNPKSLPLGLCIASIRGRFRSVE